jgi:hypothetical protein
MTIRLDDTGEHSQKMNGRVRTGEAPVSLLGWVEWPDVTSGRRGTGEFGRSDWVAGGDVGRTGVPTVGVVDRNRRVLSSRVRFGPNMRGGLFVRGDVRLSRADWHGLRSEH